MITPNTIAKTLAEEPYSNVNVFIIVYSVINPKTFDDVKDIWYAY